MCELVGILNLLLIEFVDYFMSFYLISCSVFVVSDFGGIQEEVLIFGVLVVVMCNYIECREGVDVGYVMFVGQVFECIEQVVVGWFDDCF